MTYSYQTPGYYEPVNPHVTYPEPPQYYEEYGRCVNQKTKPSSAPAGVAGAAAGAIAGALVGLNQTPFIKNGIPTDTFALNAYERYLKKASEAEKNSYGQFNEVISSLDKIKEPEELKDLFNKNPDAANELTTALNKNIDEFLSGVTKRNLSLNKKTIKSKLEAANETRYQNMKNEIGRAWDIEKKRFVKPNNMDKNVFKAIRKAAVGVKASFVAKYAALLAIAGGALTYAGHKIYVNRKYAHHE